MVGLHIFHHIDGFDRLEDLSATLMLEEWHKKKECFNNGTLFLCCSFYEGYPIQHRETEELIIVLEGIIYNRSDEDIFDFCISVGNQKNGLAEADKKIRDFTGSSDGDYIILIYNKIKGDYLIFNDDIGRLPFYFYYDSKQFTGGRSLPFVVHNLPFIAVDRNSLTGFMMNEFLIGRHTFFKNVERMSSGSILFISRNDECLELVNRSPDEDLFSTDHPFANKEEAIEALCREFILTSENRIDKLEAQGYSLINTLSGGFDSRAILGMINSLSRDFTHVTFEYSQDESETARQLLKATGSGAPYVKFSFDNKVDILDSSLIYRTGNGVNIFTTSLCYNDNLFLRNELLKPKGAVFGGLGGEFIRHPYHVLPIGPRNYLCNFHASFPVAKLLPVFNVSSEDFKKYMLSALDEFKEKTREGIFKRLYHEYYRNYIVGAGEDRNRMFSWTVHPLMSSSFLKMIRKRVPLKWSDFSFFTGFLSRIDPRLLEVPIYGKEVDLHQKKSLKKLTPNNQKPVTALVLLFVKKFGWRYLRTLTLVKKYGWRHFREYSDDPSETVNFSHFDNFYQRLDSTKDIFNYSYIKKLYRLWPLSVQYRLLSIVMYLYEIEKRYPGKIVSQAGD